MTEKYAVKKEENDGERRSRPRTAPVASDANESAGCGSKTSTTPGGVENPTKVEPEEDSLEAERIVDRLRGELLRLPDRGLHPYVQSRTRKSLSDSEIAAADPPSLAKPMIGDHLHTLLQKSRFGPDELGRYIGSLLELDNPSLMAIASCKGCPLRVVEFLEEIDSRKNPKMKIPAAAVVRGPHRTSTGVADDDKASVGTTEATEPSVDAPARGAKRAYVTMAEYARTKGELSELKARLNELREQIKTMKEQKKDDEAGRPEKPPSRRLADPSTYLRAALRCGDLRDFNEVIQLCNN